MKDGEKTKEQLIEELVLLRKRLAEVEQLQGLIDPDLEQKDFCQMQLVINREYCQRMEAVDTQVRDLTSQLIESQQQLVEILERMSVAFWTVDKQWRFTYLNNVSEHISGRKRTEMLGKTMWEEFLDSPPSFSDQYREAMVEQKALSVEGYSNTVKKWVKIDVYPWKGGLNFFVRDFTEGKNTLEQLKSSEERFLRAFHSSSSIMFIRRLSDYTFIDVNNSFETIIGYSRQEVIGFSEADIKLWEISEEALTSLRETLLLQGSLRNIEVKIRTKKGEVHTVIASSDLIESDREKFVFTVAHDITELRKLEQEVARLDRLNSMAQLAASISHEVRNPMTTVRGFLQLLKDKPEYAAEDEVFELMIEELDRANSILSEFLSLSRNQESKKELRNLNKIVKNLYPLLLGDATKSDKNIVLNQQPLPHIYVDKKEVHQLVLNLTRNGLEAMKPGGNLMISTYLDGEEVVLAVKDEGSGVPPHMLEKLGTPFVTTKDSGTGMGLAVCYSIAARNNAAIEVETSSEGTTFFVRFQKNRN